MLPMPHPTHWLAALLLVAATTATAQQDQTIVYPGGTYVGATIPDPETGAPLWHGRCAFHYNTGATFEGECADGKFLRGFLRGTDGRTVKWLDTGRDSRARRRPDHELGL